MWKGKKDRIRRNVLIKDIREGGLNAPDFETMLKTAQLKWIKKLDINASYPWKLILQHYLEKLNIDIYPLLRSDYDMKTLGMNADSLPKFYYNILKLWSEVGETSPITKRNNLWFNKKICIEKKSLFYKDFDQLGIQYVNDLYKVDGSLIPFREWMARGIKGHRLIKWMGLTGKANSLQGRGSYIKEHNENIQLILRSGHTLIPTNSKVIYKQLLSWKTGGEVNIPKVATYLKEIDDVDWGSVYWRGHTASIDTKTKEFQYRFVQDILANRYWLRKWQIEQSALCKYCNLEDEDIVHMFWTCRYTQEFWQLFKHYCEQLFDVNLNINIVFLGTDNDSVTNLIFSAKQFIYNKRIHNEEMKWVNFKAQLFKQKNIEFVIGKQNDNLTEWAEKWRFLS